MNKRKLLTIGALATLTISGGALTLIPQKKYTRLL